MKKNFLFFCFFLGLGHIVFAQHYGLFNSACGKLFTDSVEAYSLRIDTVKWEGTDSVYYNFYNLSNSAVKADSCLFWGSPNCLEQNFPSWIGEKVRATQSGEYKFFTLMGDTLSFNFNIAIGDSTLFFANSTDQFSLVYSKTDTLTRLGQVDSVKYFTIRHKDVGGNTIYSYINGHRIVIAKNEGLIQFLKVDSFPFILKPVYLVGNTCGNKGFVEVKNANLYDFQVGDEFQYQI